jgi:tetratricopeptide (TPR) repeat protein
MANRLRDEHRRLDELAVGDLAVRASFEVSFASLPKARSKRGVDPALAFCLLGLWQGPTISTPAAAALLGSSDDNAVDALELLVDANLLECISPDRYKFHDLLRVYALERAEADLPAPDCDAAITRLLTWYMCTADAAATAVSPYGYTIPLAPNAAVIQTPLSFAGSGDALVWYDSERYNIVAATRQAAAEGRHEIAWRLPAPLFWIFLGRDNWVDCIALHRIALTSAREARSRDGEAWVLNNLGEAMAQTGDADATSYLMQGLALRREISDQKGEAQSANNLADAYMRQGKQAEGLEMLDRALELNRQISYRYGEGVALVNIGDALFGLGRYEEAIERLRQAYDTFAEIKFADGLGYAEHWRGRCCAALGHHAEAVEAFSAALASHQESGNRNRQATTLRQLGRAQARAGLPDQARESLLAAADIYAQLGDAIRADEVRVELAATR